MTGARLVAVLALVASACTTSLDFDAGRPYACEPDGGADQCSPGWRCGLDARCHQVGDAQSWACRNDDDCEGGWRCGLERTCHAPGDARAWRCETNANCEGGWHCGLNQLCHAPGDEQPWACRSDADCEGNWQCGLEGVCHDETVPADYLCAPDGGLEDRWCVAPWRCGFSGRCLDVSTEPTQLVVGTPVGATLLNPRLAARLDAGVVFGFVDHHWAFATDETVSLVSVDTRIDLVTLDAGVRPLALLPEGAGTGVVAYVDAGAMGLPLPGYSGTFEPADGTPIPIAFNGPSMLDTRGLRSVGQFRGLPLGNLGGKTAAATADQCVFSVDDQGVWVQAANDGVTVPSAVSNFDLVHSQCGFSSQSPGRVLLRVGGSRGRLLGLAFAPPHFGPVMLGEVELRSQLRVFDTSPLQQDLSGQGGPGTCQLGPGGSGCGDPRLDTLVACAPCGPGDEIADVRPATGQAEVRCEGLSGTAVFTVAYGTCATTRLSGTSSRFSDLVAAPGDAFSPSQVMLSGAHGQLWFGPTLASAAALTLDEPPLAVVGSGAQTRWIGRASDAVLFPQVGLVSWPGVRPVAIAEGAPRVAVLGGAAVVMLGADGGVGARIAALDTVLGAGDRVEAAMLPDAGVLAVSVRDQLFIGTPPEWLPRFTVKALPSPGIAITSVALESSGRRAWVATQLGVWVLDEANRTWSARQMSLPPGFVAKLWLSDGDHARVAYRDGRVFTLPNGVPVVNELATGASLTDVLERCGQLWGLAGNDLVHATTARTWAVAPVAVPGVEVVLDPTLGRGKLFAHEGRVVVFNGAGAALDFATSPACP